MSFNYPVLLSTTFVTRSPYLSSSTSKSWMNLRSRSSLISLGVRGWKWDTIWSCLKASWKIVVISRASSGFAGCIENAMVLEGRIIERRKLNVTQTRSFPMLMYNSRI